MLKLQIARGKGVYLVFLLFLLFAAGAIAAACGDDDDDEDVAATGEVKTGTVRIGNITSTSGDFGLFGEMLANAVTLGAKDINDAGGVRVGDTVYMIEVVHRDTRSQETVAVAAARELIEDEGVQFIFGPGIDFFSLAVQELTQPAKVIHFASSTSFEPLLTLESVAPGGEKHYLFKTLGDEGLRMRIVGETTVEFFPSAQRSALLIPDESIGQFLAPFWDEWLTAAGHEAEVFFYPEGTTDFAPFLTRIKATNPDVLHLWWNTPDEIAQLKEGLDLDAAPAYFMGLTDPGFFVEEFGSIDVPVGLVCAPLCWGETSSAESAAYFERFEAEFGELNSVSGLSPLLYEYVGMLAEAWQIAGSVTDVDAIVAALEGLTYVGVTGDVVFNDRHTVVQGMDICVVENGEADCALRGP